MFNRENEGKTSLTLINIEQWTPARLAMSIQNSYKNTWLPAVLHSSAGSHHISPDLFPQYLMTHTEQFALLKISEKKNHHNSPGAVSNRKCLVSSSQFFRLVHTFWGAARALPSLYAESTLCGSENGEFISSFILIEVFPRVLNTQTLWFMKICNYTFCLNLQCNLLGYYGAPRTENYTNTNLTFRVNLIWSLETSMCDIPLPRHTKNTHFSGSSWKQKLWNTAARL